MIPSRINLNYLGIFLLTIYAFWINWFSANVGIMVIDTFAFFDTGFSILKNKLPIRDFWIFTGLIVDYLQALFFWVFGENWRSYVLHACFINIVASLSFYFFLLRLGLDKVYSFLYSLSFATLCYPVSGTPFAYIHSFIFSLISIFILCIAVKEKNNSLWFVLPIICFFAFFSMQTPSFYIILLVFIFSLYFFLKEKNFVSFKKFLFGGASSLVFLLLYLFVTKTPIDNFLYQYFLFPVTIGEGRLSSDPSAYVSLADQLNFYRLIGDFKFIHIFYFPLIFLSIRSFIKKEKNSLEKVNLIIIFSTFIFLFNQLVTANQIYIFSLIPLIASILHLNLKKNKINKIYFILIILLISFVTTKFHYRYNVDRKFHDLENTDKSKAIEAEVISDKMKHLKWISPYSEPHEEIILIKDAIKILKQDTRKKVLLTHYQFLSTILNEDLNLFNRWYLWDNNTHPTESHKHFAFYKEMVNENIKKNNVEVIYLLGQENEILFKNIKNYFTKKCFESKTIVKNKFSYHLIIDCKS